MRKSNGILIYSTSTTVLNKVAVGDLVSLNGKVSEFRSSSNPGYLFMTEITSPTNITIVSSSNVIAPVVLGKDRSPPTQLLNGLDVGPDGWLTVPNNASLVSAVNATLEPTKYGMDFWESLEGQLVTIPAPTAAAFQNTYGEFWVYGAWKTTGQNARGGLSITFGALLLTSLDQPKLILAHTSGPDGIPDGNPETVMIGTALDKTTLPKVTPGTKLTDITGVVAYQYVK